jgi:hypothetical protein
MFALGHQSVAVLGASFGTLRYVLLSQADRVTASFGPLHRSLAR